MAGLEYLHENQVVHGDLKGVRLTLYKGCCVGVSLMFSKANILVSSSGTACLADFGLSSVMDTELLRWTSLVTVTPTGGTVRWEAPELMEDLENGGIPRPTFTSDVYAVASVMYEVHSFRYIYFVPGS